ncbi:MAG: DNA methyltransferase [Ignavibacteria bacterium]|nr:site-specific DNA-methyltransferase [Ignavibacteria bacterium]
MSEKGYPIKRISIKSKSFVKEQQSIFEKYLVTENLNPKVSVFIGDVMSSLRLIPDETIDCIITSPPYWKQRDYKHSKQLGQEKTYQEYIGNLVEVFNQVKRVLKPFGTFFLNVGYKYQDKELLLIPELLAIELQKSGWALINKIIWYKPNAMPSSFESRLTNVYEPVFLFVKKDSKHKYYFSLDEIRISTNNKNELKNPSEYVGYPVENSIKKNQKLNGIIKNIYKDADGNFLAEILWENKEVSFELLNDFNQESKIEINLYCPKCGFQSKNEFDLEYHKNCDDFPIPSLPEKINLDKITLTLQPSLFDNSLSFQSRSNYNGKFKLSPENRGASPGARKSLFGEYFVIQRRFKVYQSLIADYLRYWREKRKITIKELDKILGYRDTASHWFRKDSGHWGKGGSIPSIEDWSRLKEILQFDDRYDRWITETHLVLQTVKPHPKGKNPGDVWQIKLQPFADAHFAVFPEELVRMCILAGCPQNGIVLDPFAGSGTTGKVAEDLGRSSILIELVPEFLEIIKKRVKNIEQIIYVK